MEEKYYKLALYIGHRIGNTTFQRDDIIAQALLGLVVGCKRARLREFESEKHERNYITRTISGYCLNYIRADVNRATLELDMDLIAPEQYSPELDFLDPDEQELVSMRLEGYTFREIAEILGTHHVALVRKMQKVREKYVQTQKWNGLL